MSDTEHTKPDAQQSETAWALGESLAQSLQRSAEEREKSDRRRGLVGLLLDLLSWF